MDGRRQLGAPTTGREAFSLALNGPRLGGREGSLADTPSERRREFSQRQVGDHDVWRAGERVVQCVALRLGNDQLHKGAGVQVERPGPRLGIHSRSSRSSMTASESLARAARTRRRTGLRSGHM
jgi:hypothetical protein